MKLPNLIIAGVNKSGTSSLFTYLSHHPDIQTSVIKETCYYLPLRYGENIENIEVYKNYFRKCNENTKIILEATPGYFYGGNSIASQIKKDLKDVKILIILRNPIERAFSFFSQLKSKNLIDSNYSFDDFVSNALDSEIADEIILPLKENQYELRMLFEGKYINYIKEWYEVFEEKNIKVIFYENFFKKTEFELSKICDWLMISSDFYSTYEYTKENISMVYRNKFIHLLLIRLYKKNEYFFRKHSKLKNKLRKIYFKVNGKKKHFYKKIETDNKLKTYYSDFNEELFQFLKVKKQDNLPSWLNIYN